MHWAFSLWLLAASERSCPLRVELLGLCSRLAFGQDDAQELVGLIVAFDRLRVHDVCGVFVCGEPEYVILSGSGGGLERDYNCNRGCLCGFRGTFLDKQADVPNNA